MTVAAWGWITSCRWEVLFIIICSIEHAFILPQKIDHKRFIYCKCNWDSDDILWLYKYNSYWYWAVPIIFRQKCRQKGCYWRGPTFFASCIGTPYQITLYTCSGRSVGLFLYKPDNPMYMFRQKCRAVPFITMGWGVRRKVELTW